MSKAQGTLASIQVLLRVEHEKRQPTEEERAVLMGFGGFGELALHCFPDPVTGRYRSARWQALGEQLQELLNPEEYASIRRSTFSAFFTSPLIMQTLFAALKHLGVPDDATLLEAGCGIGTFFAYAPQTMRCTGIELDSISARISQVLYPQHTILNESFEDTRIQEGTMQVCVGNFPFADLPIHYAGKRLSLHEFFLAKSLDCLAPGGILAVVVTHYVLDRTNTETRQLLAEKADFLGSVRLPKECFQDQGTSVICDILLLQKRVQGDIPAHIGEWINTFPLLIEGVEVPINARYHAQPEMVLGSFTRKDTLWGSEQSYSVLAYPDWEDRLQQAILSLSKGMYYGAIPDVPQATTKPIWQPVPIHASGLAEGNFFMGDDQGIYQVQFGEAIPVLANSKPLAANGSLAGKRLGHLIRLRNAARATLQTQNQGATEQERLRTRGLLNLLYDSFVATYGPINKTVISQTTKGTLVRRMPNITAFRDDPDCVLVMALEQYDEETDTAVKAALLEQDVVGHLPPVTHAETVEQALLVCLDQEGRVNLDVIAQLTGKTLEEILDALDDLIYQDPATQEWVTADVYLSGNVRAKLTAAKQAGPAFGKHVAALEAVQPEDLPPGAIDANLGAPWLPVEDIHVFACHAFGVRDSHVTVAHSAKEALWSVYGSRWACSTIGAVAEYGTERANGVSLLELALNMKSPTIYDEHIIDGKKARILNQEETLAARDKQARLKEAFKRWVFSEPARTERLVRLYNDTFNNIRLRHFDGAHLQFPGMNPSIQLAQHQVDGAWRIMSSGNTLLAHAVGAGKTYTMMAAAMKMKQAGIIRKPLWAVPNHMLEQFTRECLQLYPNARLLMASSEDFTKEKRTLMTAKMASGLWDGIITTHSAFERIGLSAPWQERFLQEQMGMYEALLVDHARTGWDEHRTNRNIIKSLEKQKARYVKKLEDLAAAEKKDIGLAFDELGIDYLFVDECFPYDTLITTNMGLLKIGEIVEKKLMVKVLSYNYSTQKLEWNEVRNWFTKSLRDVLVRVVHENGAFECTPTHKIWTEESGYVQAGHLTNSHHLRVLPWSIPTYKGRTLTAVLQSQLCFSCYSANCHYAKDELRVVPRDIRVPLTGQCQYGKTVLQQGMCEKKIVRAESMRGMWQGIQDGPGWETQCFSAVLFERMLLPDSRAGAQPAHDWKNISFQGRQAEYYCSPTSLSGSSWFGSYDGIPHPYASSEGHAALTAPFLPCRYGRYSTQDSDRGRWKVASNQKMEADRFQENCGTHCSRVESITVLERGNSQRLTRRNGEDSFVYDIEVSRTHNYFADGVLVSNCQYGKNLDAPTKMERVAGIQSGGSERAFDLYMKARYLHEQHPGHGMTFASGTPISNTMVEMYTVQRYLDPEGLEAAGLEHFDAWAATFGEVVEMLEIAPDGKTLRPRSRFAKFINLPELTQTFSSFADVQTADMLQLPTPILAGGKAAIIACPMSKTQDQLQQWLVKRYEDVRNGLVKPWEDNALSITTDGRKLALDARMVRADASPFAGAKTIALAGNVYAIWNNTHDIPGTQLIFCDLGVHPTAWGFSIYAEVMDQLVKRGVPRDQVAAVGEADTDGKKYALFEKVRLGRIRVLLGSTHKMGMGTNVQTRLIALHHLDAPWKPAEVEQREGRILRQGNYNPEVQVYRYVTEGSFDAFMWQALETKARFISQIMSGQSQARDAEDISTQALSYAEVKAIASGNPAVLTLAQTDADLQRLRLLRKHHDDEQYVARLRIKHLPDDIERLSKRLTGLQQDTATAQAPWPAPFMIHQQPCTLEQAVEQVGAHLQQMPAMIPTTMNILLGEHRGLAFGVTVHPYAAPEVYVQGVTICRVGLARKFHGPRAILNAATRLVEAYTESCRQVTQESQRLEAHLHAYMTRIGTEFPYAAYHAALAVLREQLSKALSLAPDPALPSLSSLMEEITALHTANRIDQAVILQPPPRAVASHAQAITTRIHALWAQQTPVGVLMIQPLLFNTLVEAQNKPGLRSKRLTNRTDQDTQLPLL